MADILAALEALEAEDKAQSKTVKTSFKNTIPHRAGNAYSPWLSPKSTQEERPYAAISTHFSPKSDEDGRRISFANTLAPLQGRLEIPMTTEWSASFTPGFPYNPKLKKFNISEDIWRNFSKEVIAAAEIPRRPYILWPVPEQDVIDKIKKQLRDYDNLPRVLNEWNRKNFKERGFEVSIGLPGPPKYRENDTQEERGLARQMAKKIRICITPNAESRDSSLMSSSLAGMNLDFDNPIPVFYETGIESDSEPELSKCFATTGAKKPSPGQTSIKGKPSPELPSRLGRKGNPKKRNQNQTSSKSIPQYDRNNSSTTTNEVLRGRMSRLEIDSNSKGNGKEKLGWSEWAWVDDRKRHHRARSTPSGTYDYEFSEAYTTAPIASGSQELSAPRTRSPGDYGAQDPSISPMPAFHVHSQNSSMTESSAPEDATDWDEDSDVELCTPAFYAKGQAESVVSTVLDPIKKQVVNRLMEEFWIIFNRNWPTGARKCPGAPTQDQSTESASASQLTTRISSSKNPGGYQSRGIRDEEDPDEGPAKRPGGNGKQPESPSSTNQVPLGFACPYRKRNPRKYCVGDWRSCALSPQKTVARVKGHLYRYHIIHQCQRCKSTFESEQKLDYHIETSETCDAIVAPPVDGITRKMKALLQCKKKAFPGQTEADRWKQVYQILFPLDEEVPDPYFEPLRDNEDNESLPPDPANLTNYEDFLRRMLPQFVRSALECQINGEVQPIEDRLKGQLMDVIEQAQNRAFQEYRDVIEKSRNTDSSVDSGYASNPTTSTSSLDKKGKGVVRNVPAECSLSMARPEIESNSPEASAFQFLKEDTTFRPKNTGYIQNCLPSMSAADRFRFQEAMSDDFLAPEALFSHDDQQSHDQSASHMMDLDSVDWAYLLEEDLNSM